MNDRYERELEELLHSLEGQMRREPLSSKLSRRFRPYSVGLKSAFAAFLHRPPTEQFIMSALALVVISFLLNMFGLGNWAFYAGVLSIGLFVLALALSLAGHSLPGPQQKKKWRGHEIDYEPYGPSIWTKLRSWWLRHQR